nr:hypothetical protein [Tanacetum cinerariifolium]
MNMFMKLFRSDDKFSQMLTQLESEPEHGVSSGSNGCEDDEPGDDEDGGEDGEDEDDSLGSDGLISGDMSPGKPIPSDNSLEIPRICRKNMKKHVWFNGTLNSWQKRTEYRIP